MNLGLDRGGHAHQLVPVPRQLPQLTHLRWRDPRLGRPAHPQQISKIRGTTHVVLHPPIGETLHPEWVRQMHVRARGHDRSTTQYQPYVASMTTRGWPPAFATCATRTSRSLANRTASPARSSAPSPCDCDADQDQQPAGRRSLRSQGPASSLGHEQTRASPGTHEERSPPLSSRPCSRGGAPAVVRSRPSFGAERTDMPMSRTAK